jgi:hypothetical protein
MRPVRAQSTVSKVALIDRVLDTINSATQYNVRAGIH